MIGAIRVRTRDPELSLRDSATMRGRHESCKRGRHDEAAMSDKRKAHTFALTFALALALASTACSSGSASENFANAAPRQNHPVGEGTTSDISPTESTPGAGATSNGSTNEATDAGTDADAADASDGADARDAADAAG
jgi:hypothetical protein